MNTCVVCDEPLLYRWTDTHGIGACCRCGAPYRLYHYEDNRRVEKPPELLLKQAWVPLTRCYWQEAQRNVSPGFGNFPGSSYEVATRADVDSVNAWLEAHKEQWPAPDPVGPTGGE